MIWVIFGFFAILSFLVSIKLKAKFKEFSRIPTNFNLSGKEVAEKMLRENGIYDVKVVSVPGFLTDHYNPLTKTVNLSPEVYNGRNIAAAAVAAHECGHAIQHAKAYFFLKVRSALVPVVQFSSMWVQWVLLIGIALIHVFPTIMLIGIIMFASMTLFSLITLPVEINASERALNWLRNTNIVTSSSYSKAQNALKWAAYTYVIAALSSLATLVYYILIFLGAKRDE